jgi:hypothetical protein
MNRVELFTILRPIVASVTGINASNVIMADQVKASGVGIESPLGEYATIEPKQSVSQRGQANIYRDTSLTPQSIDVDVRAQIIVEASVNVFRGVDAISRVEKLIECNKRPTVSAALRASNLGWQRTSAPNNLTRLQSGNPEQRAQIYIYLYYETTNVEVINNIESAEWEIQYEDGQVVADGVIP